MYYFSHWLIRETEKPKEILESDRLKATNKIRHVYGITEAQKSWWLGVEVERERL